jgi:hypothetical protein
MALSSSELRMLEKASTKLKDGPDYRIDDYVTNLINTVLDFQMKSPVVNSALKYFEDNHAIRRHSKLRALLDSFPNTEPGNRQLALSLWNNGHWTRASFLREIVARLEERGIRGQVSLRRWVSRADFDRDVKGRFRTKEHSIGYALFKWLQLRVGVDTVKPDVHILNFISNAIGRKATAQEAVIALEQVAKTLHRKAARLDAAIWHFQRDD